MKQFLKKMVVCEPGKGWPPEDSDRRIASKAVNEGYGMMLGFGKSMLFIISDSGRSAVGKG